MQQNESDLAVIIRDARHAKHLSTQRLALAVGVNRSSLVRIEMGLVAAPAPRILDGLARVLDLDPGMLYGLVGWVPSSELPPLAPYLRSKFAGLPDAARAEIEASFQRVATKYGYDPAGPAPGEDEH